MKSTVAALVLLLGLTTASGWLHGQLSSRWGYSEALQAAATQLKTFPLQVGDWQWVASTDLTPEVQNILDCKGYVFRTYVHPESGSEVHVALLVGPTGPIATHRPEICYSTRDRAALDERQRSTFQLAEGSSAELWGMTFESTRHDQDLLRVYYGWNDGSGWSAPWDARLSYLGSPFLYKIQIAAPVPSEINADEKDPCHDFVQAFLRVAETHLHGA